MQERYGANPRQVPDFIALSKFPHVLGRDFSGVVSTVGEGVADLRVGDADLGVCDLGQEGAYAEKIAVKAAIVANKPSGLSHVEAAALALTGLTALSAIEDTLKLQPGETILIQGGAGGVASFAIQLAKHIGARVITTASATNHARSSASRTHSRIVSGRRHTPP
jgi:NADPH:quinone reductase-like Zn-dependent oxidoreductase